MPPGWSLLCHTPQEFPGERESLTMAMHAIMPGSSRMLLATPGPWHQYRPLLPSSGGSCWHGPQGSITAATHLFCPPCNADHHADRAGLADTSQRLCWPALSCHLLTDAASKSDLELLRDVEGFKEYLQPLIMNGHQVRQQQGTPPAGPLTTV